MYVIYVQLFTIGRYAEAKITSEQINLMLKALFSGVWMSFSTSRAPYPNQKYKCCALLRTLHTVLNYSL